MKSEVLSYRHTEEDSLKIFAATSLEICFGLARSFSWGTSKNAELLIANSRHVSLSFENAVKVIACQQKKFKGESEQTRLSFASTSIPGSVSRLESG
jgi:hypothetical protein